MYEAPRACGLASHEKPHVPRLMRFVFVYLKWPRFSSVQISRQQWSLSTTLRGTIRNTVEHRQVRQNDRQNKVTTVPHTTPLTFFPESPPTDFDPIRKTALTTLADVVI